MDHAVWSISRFILLFNLQACVYSAKSFRSKLFRLITCHFQTLSAVIAPIVRPLEAWARSNTDDNHTTSYTTVNYFLIGLGGCTFLHILSVMMDRSSLHLVNIIDETARASNLSADAPETPEEQFKPFSGPRLSVIG